MQALAGLSAAQHALLDEISRHPRPVTVADVAAAMGLHQNSVRDSLAVLVDARLVARTRLPAVGRGRPSWAYESVAPTQAAALSREFADVCDAVAEHLATTDPDPEGAAHDIGVRWGRRMMDLLAAGPQAPADDLVDAHAGRIRLLMSSLGYQARADEPTRITLHQCPLRTEGAVPVPLVCQMHRGMLDEMLQTMSGGAVVGTLTPFAGADYCMIEVGASS
ncbi:MAG: MarR family transcriptional regulator, partial [Cellulomonas sp.]|nr:MarR family transcriptional regulator [Cellulomonas sp.]